MATTTDLGLRIGQMAPYLRELLTAWNSSADARINRIVARGGGIGRLRDLVANPLGPTGPTPAPPLEQYADLLNRLDEAETEVDRQQIREELLGWAEAWINAYTELRHQAKGG
jgi:hypothetical protein